MSRSKKSRKQGKLTTFLPTGPSKTELLADPASREARRKQANEKKRHQQRSPKKSAEVNGNAAKTAPASVKQREPRLKVAPAQVAAASQELLRSIEPADDTTTEPTIEKDAE